MSSHNSLFAGVCVLTLSLCACGGGGGARVASIPPPTPTPTPPPATDTVNIFPDPKPETYASIGIGVNLSTADADQPHIRYTSGGYYEIQMPGSAYDRLITLKGFIPPDPATNNQFQPQSVPQNDAYFFTSNSRLSGYLYSEMASWASRQAGGGGYVAFGSATPAGAVPVTGSASYTGLVEGVTDVVEDMGEWGKVAVGATGTVGLSFDFGAGKLDGSMSLRTASSFQPVDLGTFAFKDTVFSVGSTTYSGKFATAAAGNNFFLGRFTGPNAEETIGAWALPFLYSGDNQTHHANGAWIAKRPH